MYTSVSADVASDRSVQAYATDGLLMATPPPPSIVARALLPRFTAPPRGSREEFEQSVGRILETNRSHRKQ